MKTKLKLFFFVFLGLIICINISVRVNAKTAVADNYECYYYLEYNNTKDIESILKDIDLSAIDDYDGDLTDSIKVEDVNNYMDAAFYQENYEKRKLGTYKLICTVEDSSGNSAKIIINVVVQDTTAPALGGPGIYKYEVDIDNINLTDEEIVEKCFAFDEHDESEITKEIINGSVNSLKREVNVSQYITIRIADKSGNYIDKDIEIIMKDYTAPVINTSESVIKVSYSSNMSIQTIIENLNVKIVDNYSENLSYTISSDGYSQNKNKIGTYEVILRAEDESGNIGTKSISIVVEDTIPPVFYLDTDKITVFVDTNTILTRNDFIALLKKTNRIKSDSFEVFDLTNEYANNESTTGTYKYNIRLAYGDDDVDDYQFIVNVINKIVEKNPSFFKSIFNAIKKIGLLIYNILRWPIEKIRKLF